MNEQQQIDALLEERIQMLDRILAMEKRIKELEALLFGEEK